MPRFKITNCLSLFIDKRLHLAISCWAKVSEETRPKYQAQGGRQETKDVSATNKSTYNPVSKARESKIPGGSSVSPLKPRSLKATACQIDQIVRVGSTSHLIVHHRH